MEEIRYLGWKQPYASLMLHGKIETRTWNTNYRGLVLITASQSPYSIDKVESISGHLQHRRIYQTIGNYRTHEINQTLGKAIAVGRLVDCRLMEICDENKCFVKYRDPWKVLNKNGIEKTKMLWCHIYEDIKPIKPFEIKGSQGWRKLTSEEISKIEYL